MTLTDLPPEVRLQIYKHIFQSTTLTYRSTIDPEETEPPHPPRQRNILGILLTSRKIFQEAHPAWLQHTTFYFPNTSCFIFFLARLPPQILPRIRHITVKAFPVPLDYPPGSAVTIVHNITSLLPLFPGLQLDLLTVLDCFHDPDVNDGWGDSGTYSLADDLVESDGWRELHFHSPTTEFLNYDPPQTSTAGGTVQRGESDRWPQPFGWEKALCARDGLDSGASVKIYRGKQARDHGEDGVDCALLQSTGDEFSQTPLPEGATEGLYQDEALKSEEEIAKEILVVIKRGRGVDYAQDGRNLARDLKLLKERLTWVEIREQGLLKAAMDDPCAWL